LHDLLVHCEAVTPGEYQTKGTGVNITCGFHPTPFGECLLALTWRSICFLAFVDDDRQDVLDQLRLEGVMPACRKTLPSPVWSWNGISHPAPALPWPARILR